MGQDYQKKSYALFWAWMALFIAVALFFVFYTERFPHIGDGKNMGILTLVMLDLLFLLILATQSVYWISGITYEEAAQAGPGARRRCALRHLLLFLAATLLFLVYCFGMDGLLRPDGTRDALVAGGVVCTAAVVSSRIRL